jgi:hypothetical protein
MERPACKLLVSLNFVEIWEMDLREKAGRLRQRGSCRNENLGREIELGVSAQGEELGFGAMSLQHLPGELGQSLH